LLHKFSPLHGNWYLLLNLLISLYKRTTLYRSLLIILAVVLHYGIAGAQQRKFSFSRNKMGSPFNLVLVTDDSTVANRLADSCFSLVDSLNHVFSDYDSTSELTRVNNTAGLNALVYLSPLLWDLVLRSRFAYQASNGAFDITVGALSRVWRTARKEKLFPSPISIEAGRRQTGFQQLFIDKQMHAVSLPAGLRLDLGGVAKGYVAQQVVDYLRSKGITSSLADAGGDMAMSAAPPGTAGWTIGVNIPETTDELLDKRLLLHNTAVATSGDAYQYMEYGGKKYSHIIDPRTGYGITGQRNVTVIAKDGATADWLATACSILPIEAAKKLAIRNEAELLITELVKGRVVFHMTERFASYWKK
jgi:thiamine biosynthesis lipoprotein